MDYRIDFSAAEDSSVVSVLSAMAANSDRIELADGMFTIDGTGALRPASDGGPAVETSGMTDQSLYHLLREYFDLFQTEDNGVLVTVLGTASLTMVAITTESDAEFGSMPLGFVVEANEILASPHVFAATWPTLTQADDDDEESEHDTSVVVTTQIPKDTMIFTPLLPTLDDEADTVSFLIFGATPKTIMEDLVQASAYIAADPEFLTLEIEQSGGALDVVSFDTSDGPAVELRLPLVQAQVRNAINVLAQHTNAIPGARVFYVTEIRDDEELFIIQHIEADGFLAEPRRVTLN